MSFPLAQAQAEFYRTLGHPIRVRILELLQDRSMAVRELLTEVDVEPATSPSSWRCYAARSW